MATAVKLLVIDAMRNTESAVTGAFDERSCTPATETCASVTVDDDAEHSAGVVAVARLRPTTRRSISGNASARRARCCGSENAAGGTLARPGALSWTGSSATGAATWAVAALDAAIRSRAPTASGAAGRIRMRGWFTTNGPENGRDGISPGSAGISGRSRPGQGPLARLPDAVRRPAYASTSS